MVRSNVTVDLDGPLFDGRERRIFNDLEEDILEDYGEFALRTQQGGTRVFKNPTGAYRRAISIRYEPSVRHVEVDLPYNQWLEDATTRGPTRFAGYFLWQKTTLATERMSDRIVQRPVDKAVKRLNGRL